MTQDKKTEFKPERLINNLLQDHKDDSVGCVINLLFLCDDNCNGVDNVPVHDLESANHICHVS